VLGLPEVLGHRPYRQPFRTYPRWEREARGPSTAIASAGPPRVAPLVCDASLRDSSPGLPAHRLLWQRATGRTGHHL